MRHHHDTDFRKQCEFLRHMSAVILGQGIEPVDVPVEFNFTRGQTAKVSVRTMRGISASLWWNAGSLSIVNEALRDAAGLLAPASPERMWDFPDADSPLNVRWAALLTELSTPAELADFVPDAWYRSIRINQETVTIRLMGMGKEWEKTVLLQGRSEVVGVSGWLCYAILQEPDQVVLEL